MNNYLVNSKSFGALTAVALAFSSFLIPTAAMAVDFSGKSIQFIIPYREGGGTDVYARIFTPYLKKNLPGNPTILVRNMPGGSSVKGSNWFQRNAKPDGMWVVAVSASTQVNYLLGGKKVKFDLLKWRPIMASPLGTVIYIHSNTGFSAKNPLASIKKLQGKELRFGAKSPIGAELLSFLSYEMIGLNVKPIFGLSRGKTRQAMMRNEMELNSDTAGAYIKKVVRLVKKGMVVPVMTMGFPKNGKIVRDPAFPEIPTLVELAEKLNGKKLSGPMYDAWLNFTNMVVGSAKGFALPQGTPDDVYKTYVKAFKDTLADKKFRKSAKKIIGSYEQFLGADARQTYENAITVKPEVKKWLTGWIEKKFNITM